MTDDLLYDRNRLRIMGAIRASGSLSFVELREMLGLTDGNLSIHNRKLEEAGFVVCAKTFNERVPKTIYTLTSGGCEAFIAHLREVAAIGEGR